MGHLLADNRFHTATCVWETPLLTVEWLRSRIEETRPYSLFVIVTADKFYKPDILKHLDHVTNGRSVVIEGANHALEIPGDISKSLLALSQIVQELREFLNDDVKNAQQSVQLTVGTRRVFQAFLWLWAVPVSTASPCSPHRS